MNKKSKTILVGTIALGLLLVIGVVLFASSKINEVKKMSESTQQERQIKFLKNHEAEMTEYIKKTLPGENKIKYYWNSVNVANGVLFTDPSLGLDFDDTNHLLQDSKSGKVIHNSIYVTTDINKLKNIEDMSLYNFGQKEFSDE